jgi:hypothetical protein
VSVAGLPDGFFQTKNPNFGKKFWASDWKIFINFTAIWDILWIFGIFYDHSVHFVFIWYIFSSFGILHQDKSGSPGLLTRISLNYRKQNRIINTHQTWGIAVEILGATLEEACLKKGRNFFR